jgi:hypothetical protein
MTDTRTASSKNADLTNDQIEFAIEYLSAHAKQAETRGFFRVCGRDLTAIAELRTEQADRALAWAEAQSNRVIQPVTIETRPTDAVTVRTTFYTDGGGVGHMLFIDGTLRTRSSVSTAALVRSLKRHKITGWACPEPVGTFYAAFLHRFRNQTYVFVGDLTHEILYTTREDAQAQVDHNTNRDAEGAFKVVEVTL